MSNFYIVPPSKLYSSTIYNILYENIKVRCFKNEYKENLIKLINNLFFISGSYILNYDIDINNDIDNDIDNNYKIIIN
jgi:hypothetical protein